MTPRIDPDRVCVAENHLRISCAHNRADGA